MRVLFKLHVVPWYVEIRPIYNLSDLLLVAESQELSRDHTLGLTCVQEKLDFIIHLEKKVTTPSQEAMALSVLVDLWTIELYPQVLE